MIYYKSDILTIDELKSKADKYANEIIMAINKYEDLKKHKNSIRKRRNKRKRIIRKLALYK